MIFEEDHIYAGKILKSHGYQGDLLVNLEGFTDWGLHEKEVVFIEIDGIQVPFFIDYCEETNNHSFIIKLKDVDTQDEAHELAGKKLFLLTDKQVKNKKPVHNESLIGFHFKDLTSGKQGEIIDRINIPGNPLLNILVDGQEKTVPINDDLIIRLDTKKNLLEMQLPEGLFE